MQCWFNLKKKKSLRKKNTPNKKTRKTWEKKATIQMNFFFESSVKFKSVQANVANANINANIISIGQRWWQPHGLSLSCFQGFVLFFLTV